MSLNCLSKIPKLKTHPKPSFFARYIQMVPAGALALSTLFSSETLHAMPDCSASVPIFQIQGRGHLSPHAGEIVESCGVVTAVGFNFYFVQDQNGDGEPATSDGLYIFEPGDKPAVGDLIQFRGEVAEFIPGGSDTGNLSTTQMAFPEILDSASGQPLPDPVILGLSGRTSPSEVVISADELSTPINLQLTADDVANNFDPAEDAIDFYESLEGMRVELPNPVAVSAIRQFGSFSAEFFTVLDAGAGVTPADARTGSGGIRLQPDSDNRGDQNPERIQVQLDGSIYTGDRYPYVQVGDSLESITGVVGYSFGNFEVYPTSELVVLEGDGSGRVLPEIAEMFEASHLSLASYNVLNLSAVEDDDEQREKIAAQIVDNLFSPDIIALQEIQDNNGDIGNCSDDISLCAGVLDASATLQALIDAIIEAGGPEYVAFDVAPLVETTDDNRDDPDAFGGAALSNIRNAFLYNPDRVDLVEYIGLTRSELAARGVTATTAFDASRDPLEATFEYNGHRITVINNHFSSRFGSTPIFGGPQPFLQAAEATREAQSLAMNELVRGYREADSERHVVVLGDLNTFEFTNDLAEILSSTGGDKVLNRLPDIDAGPEEYSFIFDGNSQALDHVYVTQELSDYSKLQYVHVNVDFPRRFDDVVASDHEPLLASIAFTGEEDLLDLRGEVYSSTALELFWNRQAATVDSYRVDWSGGESVITDGTSLYLESLAPNSTYEFTVTAINAGSISNTSRPISLTTPAGNGVAADPLFRALTGAVYSSSALELFWTVEQPLPGLGFEVYRNGNFVAAVDGRSLFDDGLDAGTTYSYWVQATDFGTPVGSIQSIELTTQDGSGIGSDNSVLDLKGLVYSTSALELFWSHDVDGAARYRIMQNSSEVAEIDGRSFFLEGLSRSTSYEFSVAALDASGNTLSSETITLRTND